MKINVVNELSDPTQNLGTTIVSVVDIPRDKHG